MTLKKPVLAFISTVFLFPNDTGGKIRTSNILRGLKGGRFKIILLCPASTAQQVRWADEIKDLCDEFLPWKPSMQRFKWQRAFDLFSDLPVNIKNDKTTTSIAAIKKLTLRDDVDLVIYDFAHAAVLRPQNQSLPTVCFTHNVEAEIFARHLEQAKNMFSRLIWKSQYHKMKRFERHSLAKFNAVIAVSERDSKFFAEQYDILNSYPIPTGVDLDFFSWSAPSAMTASKPPTIVFTGSMDWIANVNGISYFLEHIWPLIYKERPDSRFLVVGRNPPVSLLMLAQRLPNVEFTGFVDDVRPYVQSAHVFVIPLLVGGGTRIKAFEAMAMGCPVVSTSIGIEGLNVLSGEHYLCGDKSGHFAQAVVDLLNDANMREKLSINARNLVEKRFSHTVASQVFEKICWDVLKEAHGQISNENQ